jgi:hypothetical protein
MKKKINLAVVIGGFIFIIFSVTLIIYGWFMPKSDHMPCGAMQQSIGIHE